MRALAVRGGAATKRNADAGYYSAIGRIGGKASGSMRQPAPSPAANAEMDNAPPPIADDVAPGRAPKL